MTPEAVFSELQTLGSAYFIVFLRIGSAAFLLPIIGESFVPLRVKLVGALALTALTAPMALPEIAAVQGNRALLAIFFSEVGIGLFLGLFVRFFVFALNMVGSIAAQSLSLSQILGNLVEAQPAISQIVFFAALGLLTVLDFHVSLVAYLVSSYEIFAVANPVTSEGVFATMVPHLRMLAQLALSLTAPFVAVSVIYNLALGFISRAMPQFMVTFVGAPAIVACGLLLLMLALPGLVFLWAQSLLRAMGGF
ncbi:MAG: flagellar biosynthetic protein FliR [Pseudomonadota bacterium]